jgi:hypothetical protein
VKFFLATIATEYNVGRDAMTKKTSKKILYASYLAMMMQLF